MCSWPDWKIKLDDPLIEGGLRLEGVVKNGSASCPLVSYVTVVRNNPTTLERTIESVQSQTYENVEHIILDGASTDETVDIVLSNKDKIDYFASEPDQGLYDALNKAIPLCKGQLILVLNSDDWLSEASAEYAASQYVHDQAQMLVGTAQVLISDSEVIEWRPKKVTANSYFSVANCNHNSIYASRKTYEISGPYDSSYKIAGDFKWIMKCYDSGVEFSYTDTVLTNYSLGGLSSDIYWHIEESKRIIKEKFTFLRGDEIAALNYVYYPWKEGFKYPLVGFDSEIEIKNLINKYSDKKEFIAAIDLDLACKANVNTEVNNKLFILKFKKSLRKYPALYIGSRWLYRKFKFKVT